MIDQELTLMAEQSVLGSLLIDNSRFTEVAEVLDAGSFGHRPYGCVFTAIAELVTGHELADEAAVCESLRASGHENEVGGLAHLCELAGSVASGSRAVTYARKVAEFSRMRRVADLAANMLEIVAQATSAETAIDQMQEALGKLQRTRASGEPKALGTFVQEAVTNLNAVAAGDSSPGWSTGLPALDSALGGGLKPGRVLVLAARTSMGKTSLATQILLHAGTEGHPGLMLSQEMTGAELATRALAHRSRIGMDRLALAQLEQEDWEALPAAADGLAALPVWIDDQPALRLVDIAAKARTAKRQHGLCVLVVDYLQLCAAEPVKGQSRHHQIEGISRGIKALAKELECCVLLLSQLNRAAEDGEPELFHLKESGAVEEDADAVLLLHRMGNEPGGQVVCCKVAKNRGGKRCRLALAFDGKHQRWAPSAADVSRRTRGGA